MKRPNSIEDLFKDKLNDYTEQPPAYVRDNVLREAKRVGKFQFVSGKLITIISVVFVVSVVAYFVPHNKIDRTEQQHFDIISKQVAEMHNAKKAETPITEPETEPVTVNVVSPNAVINLKHPQAYESVTVRTSNTSPVYLVTTDNNTITNSAADKTDKTLKAEFSCDSPFGCTPHTVTLGNLSENYDRVVWEIGEKSVENQVSVTHTFEQAGTYTVRIKAYSGTNFEQKQMTVTVVESPKSEFVIDKAQRLYTGETIKFANTSSAATEYEWVFGDGNSSEKLHPLHQYERSGQYSITLKSSGNSVCKSDFANQSIQIIDKLYKITAPTAFAPDVYGENSGEWAAQTNKFSVFYPVFSSPVSQYRLRIYNRRGVQIFESESYEKGWNGYFNHKILATDVFVWECFGRFDDGEYFHETGNVTLLNK